MQAEKAILSINSDTLNLTTDSIKINESFRTFYKLLYKDFQNYFLFKLQFQTLSEEDKLIQ